MRVIVPYAGDAAPVHPATAAALAAAGGVAPIFIDCAGSDDHYWQLLRELWRHGQPFTLVEHDIAPRPGCLAELDACPSPWCGFAYPLRNSYGSAFGCTKFGAELMAAHPGVWDEIAQLVETGRVPGKHWSRLDARFQAILNLAGLFRHTHWPPVAHYSPTNSTLYSEQRRGACRWYPWPAPVHHCTDGHACHCYYAGAGHGCPIYDQQGRCQHQPPRPDGVEFVIHPLEAADSMRAAA
jgi:hypothetical protein